MRQTTTINLGGEVLHIDTDAFEMLDLYLKGIEGHLNSSDSKEEIMQDIEARMAELFNQHMKFSHSSVVTLIMVKDVMEQLGSPEMITDGEETEAEEMDAEEVTAEKVADEPKKPHKKFYRDIDRKKLAGLCAGLETLTGIDAVWYRLAFVLLVFANGFGLLVYLVACLIVPAADTAARRLEMRGIEPSAENIQHEVERLQSEGTIISPKNTSDNSGCLKTLIIAILLICCAPFIAAIVISVVAILASGVAIPSVAGLGTMHGLEDLIIGNGILIAGCAILTLLIPIVLIAIWAIRRSHGEKMHKTTWIVALIIWLASIIGCSIGCYQLAKGGTIWINNNEGIGQVEVWTGNGGPYYVTINGEKSIQAASAFTLDDQHRPQYCAAMVDLKQGDLLRCYNQASNITFDPKSIKPNDTAALFEKTDNGLLCKADGCYNIFIALERDNDEWEIFRQNKN